MDKLRVPLSDINGNTEFTLAAEMTGSELQPAESEDVTLKHVSVSGSVSEVDTEYLFQGKICADYRRECDRCLEQSDRRFEHEVTWVFAPGPDPSEALEDVDEEVEYEIGEAEASEEYRYFDGAELDLSKYVLEELTLSAPSKFLCSDNCKGLCARCGANLNTTTCRCVSQESSEQNTGLAALGELFPELTSGPSEDG